MTENKGFLIPRQGVITLSGYGIGVNVERGHLIVKEGNRASRFSRVRHGLRRLVCISSDGFISFAALEWLSAQNAAFVLLERNGSVLAVTGPVSPSDARLRRAQSLAFNSGADLRIVRALIQQKLVGQERIAREDLHDSQAAQAISQARTALDTAATIPQIRRWEAQAGLAYWSTWRAVPVNFPKADARKVPEHWKTFGSRISPISGSPRLAVNPANAILNYLYAVLESESRLALAAVGLDPGIGFLHVDSRSRDSAACDLMEAIRPCVDEYVLDWIARQPLRREWFFEMRDGSCRLMGSFCIQLSQTAETWRQAVAPWAELVARTLWATIPKPGNRVPATPLTEDNRREGRGGEHLRPTVSPPQPLTVCQGCGAPILPGSHYCKSCALIEVAQIGRVAAQTPAVQASRSKTARAHALAVRAWRPCPESAWITEKIYRSKIQPRLADITVSALQSALGVSNPYAAKIRAGRSLPHPRHWPTLARLVGVMATKRLVP